VKSRLKPLPRFLKASIRTATRLTVVSRGNVRSRAQRVGLGCVEWNRTTA